MALIYSSFVDRGYSTWLQNSDKSFIERIKRESTNELRMVNEEREAEIVNLSQKIKEQDCEMQEQEIINKKLRTEYDDLLKKYREECSEKAEQIAESELKINVLSREIEFKNNIINELKNKDLKNTEKITRQSAELKSLNKLKNINNLYLKYNTLDNSVLEGLSNTIDRTNCCSFFVSASQLENIKTLWTYIQCQLDLLSDNDKEILEDTFDYFFETYNSYKHIYSMLDTTEGDEFDSNIHSKASSSKSSGTITEVLLRGYKNIITGKIEAKSVVRVK